GGAGRGFGGGQHCAARPEGARQRLRRRQGARGPGVASPAVPALPRHARRRHQPDPREGRHEAARPRHRRAAPAVVRARRRRRGPRPPDARRIRSAALTEPARFYLKKFTEIHLTLPDESLSYWKPQNGWDRVSWREWNQRPRHGRL